MFWTHAARESEQPRSSSDLIRYSLSPDHARPRPLPHAALPDAYSPQPGHPYASSASTSHHSYPPPYPDEAIHTPAPFVPPRAPRPRPSKPHPPRGGGPDDDVQGYFLQAPSSAAHGHQQHVPPGQAPQAYHEESWGGEPHWSGASGEGVERLGGGEDGPMAGFHDAQQPPDPCPPFQRQHFLPLPQPQHPHPQFLHRRHKQPQPASYPSAGPLPPSSAPMSVGGHVDSAAPPLVYRHNVNAPLASTASSSPVSSSSHGGGLVRRPSNTFPSTTTTSSSGASSVAHHLERSLYVDPAGAGGPLGSDQGLALVSASSRTWDSLSRTFGYEHSFDKVEEENVDGGGQFLSPSSLSGADFSSSSDGHPSGPASHDGQHPSIQQQQQQQLQQHPHLLTMQEHSHHHLQSLSSSLSSSFSSPLSSFLQSHDRPSAPSSTTHSSLWSGIGDGIGDGSLSYGPSSARHDSSHHLLQPVLLSQSHYEVPLPPPQISSSSESSSSLLQEGEGESEVENWEDDAAPAPTPPVKRPRLSTTDAGPLNSEPLRPTAAGAFFFTSASASETTPAFHLKKKVKGGPPALTPDGRPRRGKIPTSCAECRRLKMKCDQQVPCGSCIRRGCPSVCPHGKLANLSGKRLVLASTEQLHERVTALEAALAISYAREHPSWADDMGATGESRVHPLLIGQPI